MVGADGRGQVVDGSDLEQELFGMVDGLGLEVGEEALEGLETGLQGGLARLALLALVTTRLALGGTPATPGTNSIALGVGDDSLLAWGC